MKAPDDYYERWTIGTLIRFLRYLTAFISVFLPALYIALTSFHPGMIPSKLALSIAANREGVPFPAAITFRILRFGFMFVAAFFGLYGIIMAYIFLNIHMCRLKSFGVVYTTPFGPYKLRDWKDLVVRLPISVLRKRPATIPTDDTDRMG
ncbi:spore germination protein [Effusibacillus lacus]|uniref:Spore germination protein n=1 Tax=Effusibacillus lacus TaxID=1348429 RepID=A0A292YNU4_9BACL|nr:GerA spore germination protein [Effusibacillus lacus]GAX90140.1 spore germination protein [Effusibacillus lacus]